MILYHILNLQYQVVVLFICSVDWSAIEHLKHSRASWMQREGSIDSNVQITFEHVLDAFDISIIVENRLEMRKLWALKGKGGMKKLKKTNHQTLSKKKGG